MRLYRVKDARRVKDLVEIARATRQQAPWSKYRNILAPAFFQYIEYETSASIIRSYETIAIPGLLQTEEYATAVTRNNSQSIPGKAVRMLVEVRMKRQELLNQPKPPLLYFVLDEAVIYRLMGDKGLREAQLAKLINLADRPGVTIEVLPFSAGLHRGMSDTFSLLEFPGSADDVLYLESSLRGSIFTRDSTEEVAVFRELFGDLREMSLGPEGTRDYLIKTADAIR